MPHGCGCTSDRLWTVILAGGDGTRMADYVRARFGRVRPKQYCAFVGTRSMFQHTIDRVAPLAPPERTVTIVARHHQGEVAAQLRGRAVGQVIVQPANRDTAAGIFLPLMSIWARDPDSTVALFPADHFINPEAELRATVRRTLARVTEHPDRVFLVGVPPDGIGDDYGWILPGDRVAPKERGRAIEGVAGFVEKPDAVAAASLTARGAVWNSFIMIARVQTLWALGWEHVPELMTRMERLARGIGLPEYGALLDALYRDMPAVNFSSALLQRSPERLALVRLTGVEWSDWGRPERVRATMARLAASGHPKQPFREAVGGTGWPLPLDPALRPL